MIESSNVKGAKYINQVNYPPFVPNYSKNKTEDGTSDGDETFAA